MAITGIDTIEGKQIIAAGAVSAKSAEMAYNDENGNPITGYQVAGDYLTTADSANFYTTANESGFITGVPAGTMNESAFGYDASDNITGYNGSAFKAGDEFPQSATEAIGYVTATSANIDSTIDNVSSNSGAWGGSALPISAGPGIKFSMVDNTLMASTDETLLWSGNGTSITAFTVSEPLTNFKEVVFNIAPSISYGIGVQKVIIPIVGNNTSALYLVFDSTWDGFTGINFTYKFNNTGMSAFSLSSGAWFGFNNNGVVTGNFTSLYGYEIYGVKRIAGGE